MVRNVSHDQLTINNNKKKKEKKSQMSFDETRNEYLTFTMGTVTMGTKFIAW